MQNKPDLKLFCCPDHPTEFITATSISLSEKNLYCVKCMMETQKKCNEFSTIMDIFKKVGENYCKLYNSIKEKEYSNEKYSDILLLKDECLARAKAKVEIEKQKFNEFHQKFLKTLINSCEESKEYIMRKLDEQLFFLEHYFSNYEEQLQKVFVKQKEINEIPSLESLKQQLDTFTNVDQLNALIQNCKVEILDLERSVKHSNPGEHMINQIESQMNALKSYCYENVINLVFHEPQMATIKKKIWEELYSKVEIANPIRAINVDSAIVPSNRAFRLYEYTKAKILSIVYRGSRDGFEIQHYSEKCAHIAPTLTIMKSSANKIFGFYSSEVMDKFGWDNSGEAWMFSLDHDKVYPHVYGNKIWRTLYCGIHVGENGITYCKDLRQGTAFTGNSFSSPEGNIDLAGASTLIDIEVFQVIL